MASEQRVETFDEVAPSRAPQPVEGGTEPLESLGRFIDGLMGDARRRRRVAEELAPLLLSDDEMPVDPPASEAPPPVPGGIESMA
jgi:hypothetical protein